MSYGQFPNNNCAPNPNWECSDDECYEQCITQPTFDLFYECCIQCALAHYRPEAKDHVTVIVANAVFMIGNEYVPIFDQMQMVIATPRELSQKEQVTSREILFFDSRPMKKYTFYDNVQVYDIGQPCSSPTGFCVPLNIKYIPTPVITIYGVTAYIPFSLPPSSSHTTSEPCPEYCSDCICYHMFGIDIVDPTDAVYHYQETPTGIVQQVPQNEYVVFYDSPSLRQAPSHLTETEGVDEGVSFVLSYLITATLPVLELSLIYPVTLIREIESITATKSVQTAYFSYPISKQTFAESITATSVSVLGYFQPPIKLITESEVTYSSQQILKVKLTKSITFYQSIPTSISQLIATIDVIKTIAPERLAEYTDAVRSVIDALVFQIVTEVLKSEPISVSEGVLVNQVSEVVKKVLIPEVTSSTQEFLDSLIYQTVKQVVENVLTSQSETSQVTYFSEKVTPTQTPGITSQSTPILISSVYKQISAQLLPESTQQTEQVMDVIFGYCLFVDNAGQCYNTVYNFVLYNQTSTTIPSGYPIPIWIWVNGANSTYSNIRIGYNDKEVCTWVEQIINGVALMWIVLPADLQAGSTIALSVYVGESSYVYDGVAGAYKEIAGCEYDNGNKVFTFYDNFCGTSIDTNNWNIYASGEYSYEVNNDLIITATDGQTGYFVLQTKNAYGEGYMFEVMSSMTGFSTNIRTAQPSISPGNGVCYAFTDNIISSCSTSSTPVADFSINGNCIPYYVEELGEAQSTVCPSSCPSSSSEYCETSQATYMVFGLNFPFRKLISGFGYYNNNVSLVVNRVLVNGSMPNQSISGNVYMYIGVAYEDLNTQGNPQLELVYHFARIYPVISVESADLDAPPFWVTNMDNFSYDGLYFNGSNSYGVAEIPQSNSYTGSRSYAVWFKTTSPNGIILGDANANSFTASNYDVILSITNGYVIGSYYDGNCVFVKSSKTYNDGNWHLAVVVIVAGSEIQLWIDGEEVGSAPFGTPQSFSPYYLFVGYNTNTGCWQDEITPSYFEGYIAGVAYFNFALGSDAIQSMYNAGVQSNMFGAITDGLFALYYFQNGGMDLTANGNDMSFYNVSNTTPTVYVNNNYYFCGTFADWTVVFVDPGHDYPLLFRLTTPTTGQTGGFYFPFSYDNSNVLTISGEFTADFVSGCPADGFGFGIFASSVNPGSVIHPCASSGCPACGSIGIPEPSSPTIVIQSDPYYAESCGVNRAPALYNVWIVNGSSVTGVTCGAGSGTYNTPWSNGDNAFFLVSYIPSTNQICALTFFIPNNQFSTTCVSLGSDFSVPSSGTYYLIITGSTGGQYGEWLFNTNSIMIGN